MATGRDMAGSISNNRDGGNTNMAGGNRPAIGVRGGADRRGASAGGRKGAIGGRGGKGERVRQIPLPLGNNGSGVGNGVDVLPILSPVRDENLGPSANRTGNHEPGRPRLCADDKPGIRPDTLAGGIGRRPNTPEEGSVNEEGGGEAETVDANIADGVPTLNLGGGEDCAQVLDEGGPRGARREGKEAAAGTLDTTSKPNAAR